MEENAEMERIVQDHERRIADLEKNHSEIRNEIRLIQGSQYKIENTVLNESKEQKDLLNKLVDHHLGMKTSNNSNRWKFAIALVSGGGLFYVVFEAVKAIF